MNIARSFVDYMEDQGLGTFGTDIFIGAAPLEAPDPMWWVISSGGASNPQNTTGERVKQYTLNLFYRSTDAEDVYDTIEAFETEINSGHCTALNGYDSIDMTATSFPTDQDIDRDDRTVSMMEVTLTVYQS